ncbi:MAG TPA: oligosaccharide flippase family protein [Gaiellaceae bacterium]|nr:oligosaccharide flippase family protein [Gaiellaceae bacterium]
MLARAVGLNVAGQAVGFGVAFFSAIILARALGPSDRGLLAIMVVITTIALALAGGGLQVAVQYYAGRPETPQRGLLGNTLAYGGVLAVVFVPLFLLLHGPIATAFAHGRGGMIWVLAALLVPLTFLDYSTAGQLCGRLEFGVWNLLLVVARLASLAAAVVLVVALGLGVAGGVIATATSSVVVVCVATARLLRDGRPRIDLTLFRRSVRYGTKAQVGAFFQFVNFRLDVLILSLFAPLASVGNYAVAQTLAELVAYLGVAFQISVLPILARSDGDAAAAETSARALRHHSLLALGVILVNAICAPLVLLFGYGRAFEPALVPLLVLLPGMWFMGTGSLVVGDLRGRGRPGLASAVKGGAAVVTIALDLALIPFFGVLGAAVASSLAYAAFGIAALVVLSRHAGVPVRELAIPTRADLAVYRRAGAALLGRLRRQSPEGDGRHVVGPAEPLVVGD